MGPKLKKERGLSNGGVAFSVAKKSKHIKKVSPVRLSIDTQPFQYQARKRKIGF
jgi:hypothetical protein